MVTFDTSSLKNARIELSDIMKFKGKKSLEVGFYNTAKYENGVGVPSVAYWQEFGTHKIPARPFFRNACEANVKKWYSSLGDFIKGGADDRVALSKLGELIRADVITSIGKTNAPALKPATIAKKGSSKPLIDTGLMRRSVTYKVI